MMDVSVRTVAVVADLVFALLGGGLAFAASPDEDEGVNASVDDLGVDRVHADGVTGENVTMAVLDPMGFDTDDGA